MEHMKFLVTIALVALNLSGYAETLSGLCMVSASHNKLRNTDNSALVLSRTDCENENGNCGTTENSNISWSRWNGVSANALSQEGTQLVGRIEGEAGTLQCSGVVHDGVLAGRYQFTPNTSFIQKMSAMGFEGITERKAQGFLMLDITSSWVQQIKDIGVTDLSTNKLMGLKALRVDQDYIHAMAAAGYPELRANKLTEMKAVGVTPEKAQEAKALGFQPTEQELIQMSIFKVDRAFVERMRAKGLNDLSLAKLIKVKIFNLEQ
jgi:hypothetical protein